jgi:hypothetical protein
MAIPTAQGRGPKKFEDLLEEQLLGGDALPPSPSKMDRINN